MITAERIQKIAPSATLALTAKAKDLKSQGHPVVSLAAGEPDFPVPPEAKKAIVEALEKNFTRYTPTSGTPELKAAIQKKIKEDQGLEVQANEVVVSCGAKHSLYNLIQVLCGPGDEVVLPRPYWVSYPEMIRLAGAVPVYVDTFENRFLSTADLIEKAVTPKTKLLILNSPSNPTGAVLSESEVRQIADLLVRRKLYCVSDEIYEYYVYGQARHVSVAGLVPNFRDYVAVVNGVSKSYAMTGLRIGYTVAHKDIISKIGILQDHSTSNPTSLSQVAAVAALGLGRDFKDKLKRDFEKKRELMVSKLSAIKRLKVFEPQGAFYVFASVKDTGLRPEIFSGRLLDEKFVAVIPGESFGAPEWVRLSFAASVEEIEEGTRRLKEWVEALP